jgi:outer membrane murein-binding lipoprotein Lpp
MPYIDANNYRITPVKMTILAVLSALVALAGAASTVWAMIQTHVTVHSQADRMNTLEERLQRMQGKQAAEQRWTRDEIRDAVDQYVQTLDLQPGGASMEDLLPMLMQMQMGSGSQAPGPQGTGGDSAPSDVEIARTLAGSGGNNG